MAQLTVRTRSWHGTRSLDLTIPVSLAKEMEIRAGDVFVVEATRTRDGDMVLSYRRIFKQSKIA